MSEAFIEICFDVDIGELSLFVGFINKLIDQQFLKWVLSIYLCSELCMLTHCK